MCTRAIQIDPGLGLAYVYRGLARLRQAADAEFRQDFRRRLTLRPDLKPYLDEE